MTALDSRVTLTLGVVRFAMAVAAPTLVLWLHMAFEPVVMYRPMLLLFIAPIALCAHLFGWQAGLLSTAASAVATAYALFEPRYAFMIEHPADVVQWSALVCSGTIVSLLMRRRPTPEPVREAAAAWATLARAERSVQLGFGVALLLLTAIGTASFIGTARTRANALRTNTTLELIGTLRATLAATVDVETAGRGFALTGDDAFLEPYAKALPVISDSLAALRANVADDAEQGRRLAALEPVVSERIAQTERVIALRRNGDLAGAQAAVSGGFGKRAQDEIRRLVGAMEGAERTRYQDRQSSSMRTAVVNQAVILGGTATALVVVGLAWTGFSRDFAGRRRAESALRTMNESLELRVKARTKDLQVASDSLAEREAAYRALIDNMLNGVMHGALVYENGKPVDVRVVSVNSVFAAHSRFGDITGRHLSMVLVEPALSPVFRGLLDKADRVVRTGVPDRSELQSPSTGVWFDFAIFRLRASEFILVVEDITARKNLDEARVWLERIVEASDDAIIGTTLEDVVTTWSHGAEAIFGYTAAEAVGQPLAALIVLPEDEARYRAMIVQVAAGQSVRQHQAKRRTKKGRFIEVSVSASPVRDANGHIVGVTRITRDVTALHRLDRENREQEARTEVQRRVATAVSAAATSDVWALLNVIAEQTVEHLADGCSIWAADGQGWLKQVAVASRNSAAQEMMRRNPLHLPVDSPLPPAVVFRSGQATLFALLDSGEVAASAPEQIRALFQELDIRSLIVVPLRAGESFKGVLALRRGPNEPPFGQEDLALAVDLAERAAIGATNAQLRERVDEELRERQRAEHAARAEQDRFQQVVENIQEVFWITDVDQRVLYLSPGYERVWGRTVASHFEYPSDWAENVHPDDRVRVVDAARTKQLIGTFDETYRIIRPDGGVRWVRSRAFPIRNEHGEVFRIAGISEDITEWRALEDQLRQSQKMDAIGQLASGVAHDFNNLLTAIQGNAYLSLHEADTTVRDENLDEIIRASERAAALTRQLLLFSRKQAMEPVPLNLNDVIGGVTRLLQRVLGEDVTLRTSLASGLPMVEADPGMIEQILLNLAVNARDAMPTGGALTLSTSTEIIGPLQAVRYQGLAEGEAVVLTVHDTGTGIAPDVLPHIFEPFFTTKEPGKGTGLGLATVYGIVKLHDGWISAENGPGVGASFVVRLPALARDVRPGVTAVAHAAAQGGDETVLVVEDEMAVRLLITNLLERHGYTVLTAGSGTEAVEVWRETGESVDLLLTDMVMPNGMTGRELAMRLTADRPDLKVLYSSGYSTDERNPALALVEGVNFLHKPYSPTHLLKTVRACLDQPANLHPGASGQESE